jgi:uncharacterized protein
MLENLVFLELKRRKLDLCYHRGQQECDFIVTENERSVEVIQVTMALNGNQEREYNGLLEAMKAYGLDRRLILTEGEEFEETVQGKNIIVRPIWKWHMATKY